VTCRNKKTFNDNATLQAEKKGFTALGKHLKLKDRTDRTVIAVRVQNEPGIIDSNRDYDPVPVKMTSSMNASGTGIMFDFWQKSGSNKSGAWPALFSWEAGEIMTTWS
jgi:hypothetical protein